LLRSQLLRDRLRCPIWVFGIAIMAGYFANGVKLMLDQPESLSAMMTNPAGVVFMGPAPSNGEISLAWILGGGYCLYLAIAAGVMSVLTITRHCRLEEQSGRLELIRAQPVSRLAPLISASLLTLLMNLAIIPLTALVLQASGYGMADGLAYGVAVAGVGVAFAGVAALTSQITQTSRSAAGIAGALLGASFLLRGIGDMSRSEQGDWGWLSLLTPNGWAQRIEPLTSNNLVWAIGPMIVWLGGTTLATVLSTRRDLGAGAIQPRPGKPAASRYLASPFSLALRLQRGSLLGWSITLLLTGLTYGLFTNSLADSLGNSPQYLKLLGGDATALENGYIALLALIMGLCVSAFAVMSVQALHAEEKTGRIEAVLASAISRSRWVASWLASTATSSIFLLIIAGFSAGLGASLSGSSNQLLGRSIVAHLAYIPACWLTAAVAVLLYGLRPALTGLSWLLVVFGLLAGLFGALLSWSSGLIDLSPYEAVGRLPLDSVNWIAVGTLLILCAIFTGLALTIFRRRDLKPAT
jgi:ABC-2 type transport system permease protein